jgi:hypothetical protein
MSITPLAPAEAYVLLYPNTAGSAEVFKIAFLSLVATRVLKITMVERPRLLRTKAVPVASIIGETPADALAAEIVGIVRTAAASATEVEFPAIARVARKSFGPSLDSIQTRRIRPLLIRRGLLTSERRRFLWFFRMTWYEPTPQGLAEKQRIEATLERARKLPELLHTDPEEAKAIILAAGPLLLLAPELKGHYGALAALDPKTFSDVGGGDNFYAGSDHHGSDAHGHHGAMDFGSFDFGSFDAGALDMDFSSFDASFDSSISDGGGDGGSDGGGGHH